MAHAVQRSLLPGLLRCLLTASPLCRYGGITQFPEGFVEMVKKWNPHITELELSRCVHGCFVSHLSAMCTRTLTFLVLHASPKHASIHPVLHSNNLVDLPDNFDDFRYIRILRLKYNQFKKLPAVVSSEQQGVCNPQ